MANLKTNAVNAYETTLSSALAAGATTINVTDTTGSPAVPFYVVLDPGNDSKREVVLVDGAKTATTFTLSAATSRGRDGTSDVAHDSGAVVAIVPVAAMFNDLQDRVDASDTALTNHEGAADPHAQYLTAAEGNAAYVNVSGDTMTGALIVPDGTAAAPGVGFSGSTNTGIRNVTGSVRVVAGGVDRVQVAASSLANISGAAMSLGTAGSRWSAVYTEDGTAAAPAYTFGADTDTGIYLGGTDNMSFAAGGVGRVRVVSSVNTWEPIVDNVTGLGRSGFRWSQLWAGTTTIATSDEEQKNTVVDTPLGLDFVKAVRPIDFVYNGGKRTHVGFSAQQIKEALDAVGAGDRAFYIDPAVGATQAEQAGPPPQEPDEDDEDYAERVAEWRDEIARDKTAPKGIRYSELIAPLYQAVQEQQAIIEQQAATIADLVARVEALEAK